MIPREQVFALGVVWVGGWGFLFFTYPALVSRIFRVKNPTPKRLKAIKIMGAVGLALIFISAISYAMFGLN